MHQSLLNALSPQHSERKIVTIDGPAGSGKTTLASELELQLEYAGFCVEVIHMDDLYNGWEKALSDELTQSLQTIVEGYRCGDVSYKVYDWHEKSYTSSKSFLSPDVLILEGVGSGQRAIRNECDLAIWIEVEPQLALQRVIERDGKAINDIQAFMAQWFIDQAAHFHNEGTQGAADYCIDGAP
jgi:uridine kinase